MRTSPAGGRALRVSAYSGYGGYEIAVHTGEAPGGGMRTDGDTISGNPSDCRSVAGLSGVKSSSSRPDPKA